MNRHVTTALLLLLALPALAADQTWLLRVDGLACPYCAWGVEKKLKAIKGVKRVDVDLEKGVVQVQTTETVQLKEAEMKALMKDAGFTFRSMKKQVPP